MKVKTKFFLFVLLIFTVSQSILFAGTTGKLTGKVTDKETGEPLPFVNVLLNGTSLGAATDVEGYYVILNIPPGKYSVNVKYVGYQPVVMENVPISVDLTTTRDFQLSTSTVELGTLIVTAERPLVVKDMTSSLSTTTADQIENLPVSSVQQILRLNAGVIESDGRLYIRGGRAGEIAYWVDGISATDVYDGRIGANVENSAIQELQVISGTFNAEYGQAMSGIINIITKEGGENYTGQVKVYGGDYLSNADEFSLYKSLVTDADPATGLTRIVSSEKDYPLKKINPVYNGEFSLSGPVPFAGNSLTFFTNGRYFYDEGYFYGRNWYRPTGAAGDNSLVALNPNETTSLQGKLTYKLGSSLRFSYNIFWNKSKRERNYFRASSVDYQFNPEGQSNFNQFDSRVYKYAPYGIPQSTGEAYTHTFSVNHVLSSSTFYEARFSRYHSESKQFVYDNPLQSVKYIAQVAENTELGIPSQYLDPLNIQADSVALQQIIAQGGSFEFIPDPNGPDGYIGTENVINAPTSYSFMNRGMDKTHTERSTSYYVGKIDFTSQLNRQNQLKFGAEARMHELELHSYQLIPETDESGQTVSRFGKTLFYPSIPNVGNIYRNDYLRKPREVSLYIQNKVEFSSIILNLGLRWDYFDANAYRPTDPADPNIYDPFKDKNRYRDNNGNGVIEESERVTSNQYTAEERRAFMQEKVDAKTSISPRLGIAFPITDRGVIHFSYGHFFKIPEFQYLYSNPDFKITSGSGTAVFGNPDLEPEKTVMYELGLQQQLTEDIGVDLTIFYRDVRNWVGTSPIITTAKVNVQYSNFENKDYENVKGITLKVEKRFSDNYSFRVDYTLQTAEGTYSNPNDAYNASLAQRAPTLALIPMNWDQTHTLNAQIIYDLSSWTFSLIGRYWSGRPYTPSFARGESGGTLPQNSSRRPTQKIVDLTVNKRFNLVSDLTLELFVNVYNLLDQRDQTNVYTDTGSADYTTTIDPSIIPYNANRISTPEEFVLNPANYTAPRQVQVGLILGF